VKRRRHALQVPEGWQSGKIFNWSQQSKDQLFRGRIANYLLTCEMPCTVGAVAQATKTSCKHVRAVVQDLKRNGVLIESSFPKHFLLRLKA